MILRRTAGLVLAWTVLVTGLHLWLNVDWSVLLNDRLPAARRKFNVAYIPVTCHLTCPVTDYVSRLSRQGNIFIPKKFQGFPELKDALIANRMQAGFIVAPMAIALRSQGVPIKIVYLGHRYGSAVVVRKDGPVHTVRDLAGKTIAIPSR
ncbi:MAG TPA: ABC transporter substrate-binding protein, partial [Thermoanaerobaculia bacterium]|nr:ABC transporter substrate-binding protein [Thermoanaerobaculia bacterium]